MKKMFIGGRWIAAQDERAATAVQQNGKLIGLDDEGRFHVWGLENGQFDEATSARLLEQGKRNRVAGTYDS